MEFILTYEGELKSNANGTVKNQLRSYFHPQLKDLWNGPALMARSELRKYPPDNGNLSFIEKVDSMYYLPVVSEKLKLICRIDILMLRPEAPGNLVTGGDIDNRIKTLLDGLRTPHTIEELPRQRTNQMASDPFHVLLQDDKLITAINVEVGQLLNEPNSKVVKMIIRVDVKPTVTLWGNIGF